MRASAVIVALSAVSTAAYYSPSAFAASRSRPVVMKGKGSRGMPGKATKAAGPGGFSAKGKKSMQKREMDRDEWTLVAAKGDLGEEFGSMKAVEAGQSPQGQNYIWTLIRGPEGAGAFTEDVFSNVWVVDGSCRACTAPMFSSTIGQEPDGRYAITCGACSSKWALDDGEVIDWLPGNGPMGFITKKLNEEKEPMAAGILKTRVAKSGRIYLRLPDGTLKIQKTAAERADELANFGQTA